MNRVNGPGHLNDQILVKASFGLNLVMWDLWFVRNWVIAKSSFLFLLPGGRLLVFKVLFCIDSFNRVCFVNFSQFFLSWHMKTKSCPPIN
jgi:hypothetical protein